MKTRNAANAWILLFGAVAMIGAAVSCGGTAGQVREEPVVVEEETAAEEEEEDLTMRKVVVPAKPKFVEGVDKEAQKAFKRGVVAISQTPPEYDKGLDEFEDAISRDKAFLEAYFNLGMIHERQGRPKKAIRVYEKAMEANPGNLDAEAYMGKVYLALSHQAKAEGDTLKAGEFEVEAKDIFDSIIAKAPDNVTANNALALYWLFRGERDTAEDFVKKVLMMQPKNVVALNTRGLINLMSGKLKMARWVFEEKALKEDPNSTEAWTNLGLTYMKMGKTPEAVTSFEKAIQLNPDNVPALLNVAAVYLDYLHYKAALREYDRVLKLVPDSVEALIGSGSSLLGLHRPADAVERWDKALELDPRRTALYARSGTVYETLLNDMEKAIAAYDEYVRLANPPDNDPIKAKLPVLKQIQAQGGMLMPEPEPEPEAETDAGTGEEGIASGEEPAGDAVSETEEGVAPQEDEGDETPQDEEEETPAEESGTDEG